MVQCPDSAEREVGRASDATSHFSGMATVGILFRPNSVQMLSVAKSWITGNPEVIYLGFDTAETEATTVSDRYRYQSISRAPKPEI